MTSATDELRRMLDERGVEYFKHEDGEPLRKLEKADEPATSWHMGGASVCAVPIEGSDLFDLWIDHLTPAQAIDATLGRGTCRALDGESSSGAPLQAGDYDEFWEPAGVCSECGELIPLRNYCPNCGARVIGA